MKDLETAQQILMEIGFVSDPEKFERAQHRIAEALLDERRKMLDVLNSSIAQMFEAATEDSESAALPEATGFCVDCLERQFRTMSGLTCPNGHGGADTIEACYACERPVTAHADGCDAVR